MDTNSVIEKRKIHSAKKHNGYHTSKYTSPYFMNKRNKVSNNGKCLLHRFDLHTSPQTHTYHTATYTYIQLLLTKIKMKL